MKCPLHKLSGLCKGRISLSGGEALCATGYQKVISSCFAPQGQKQGKTELFMAADQREMHGKSMGFRDLDKREFVIAAVWVCNWMRIP
jgi:hypothetical protein